jgi:hypothetical protein
VVVGTVLDRRNMTGPPISRQHDNSVGSKPQQEGTTERGKGNGIPLPRIPGPNQMAEHAAVCVTKQAV